MNLQNRLHEIRRSKEVESQRKECLEILRDLNLPECKVEDKRFREPAHFWSSLGRATYPSSMLLSSYDSLQTIEDAIFKLVGNELCYLVYPSSFGPLLERSWLVWDKEQLRRWIGHFTSDHVHETLFACPGSGRVVMLIEDRHANTVLLNVYPIEAEVRAKAERESEEGEGLWAGPQMESDGTPIQENLKKLQALVGWHHLIVHLSPDSSLSFKEQFKSFGLIQLSTVAVQTFDDVMKVRAINQRVRILLLTPIKSSQLRLAAQQRADVIINDSVTFQDWSEDHNPRKAQIHLQIDLTTRNEGLSVDFALNLLEKHAYDYKILAFWIDPSREIKAEEFETFSNLLSSCYEDFWKIGEHRFFPQQSQLVQRSRKIFWHADYHSVSNNEVDSKDGI